MGDMWRALFCRHRVRRPLQHGSQVRFAAAVQLLSASPTYAHTWSARRRKSLVDPICSLLLRGLVVSHNVSARRLIGESGTRCVFSCQSAGGGWSHSGGVAGDCRVCASSDPLGVLGLPHLQRHPESSSSQAAGSYSSMMQDPVKHRSLRHPHPTRAQQLASHVLPSLVLGLPGCSRMGEAPSER